jgi:hypothetical protein
MVVSYNQNLRFKIHCKKLQKQDYISFHHIFMLKQLTQQYEQEIHYRNLCFSILL